MWGTFLADVAIQMLGTDYARILRAIYAFAQVMKSCSYVVHEMPFQQCNYLFFVLRADPAHSNKRLEVERVIVNFFVAIVHGFVRHQSRQWMESYCIKEF